MKNNEETFLQPITQKTSTTITIPVMHCFDNNYVIPAAVSFYSMLKHANPAYLYHLYVLHTDIIMQNQKKLHVIVEAFPNAELTFFDMNDRFEDLWQNVKNSSHFSKEVLYKLIAPSLFPQHDKLIITDVDVVFLSDISPSYFLLDEAENPNALVAGVKPICPNGSSLDTFFHEGYAKIFGSDANRFHKICGGYLVYNLQAMRAADTETKFTRFLKENALLLIQSEQDVINFCLEETQISYLPLEYVVCSYMYEMFASIETLTTDWFYSEEKLLYALKHPVQLHFAAATKPWNSTGSAKADIWYKYLAECGMLKEHLQKSCALLHEPTNPMTLCSNIDILKTLNMTGVSEPVVVSIVCVSYNHEKYIEKTLQHLLSQKTNFTYEIIISDDASTDKTQAIIQKYAKLHPEKIIATLRKLNVGIGKNMIEALAQVRGKYLALCDGDDYWIDKNKLQCQIDFLEKNPDFSICSSAFIISNEAGQKEFNINKYLKKTVGVHTAYSFKDLMIGRFIASCTVVMRWKLQNNIPFFLESYPIIDFPLLLIHSAFGKIHIMSKKVFSQYNIHSSGVMKSNNTEDLQKMQHLILKEVDLFLDYRYHTLIEAYLKEQKTPLIPAIKKELSTFTKKPIDSFKNILLCLYKSIKNRRIIRRF